MLARGLAVCGGGCGHDVRMYLGDSKRRRQLMGL